MELVEHYDRGGDDKSNLSKDIRALNLSATEKDDLVAFMLTLTGRGQSVSVPALPQSPKTSLAAPPRPFKTARTGD